MAEKIITESMRIKILLFAFIFNSQLSIVNCPAQTVQRERTFEAAGLYGFMNGGADQFFEYDVQKLTVADIVFNDENYTIEIYEMATPEDAFGIYSLHTFKCLRADTLDGINCLSSYQLQAVLGNIYASVVFPSGSQAAMANADEVLRIYAPHESPQKPEIPVLPELKAPVSGNLKYLRGPLSVSKASFSFAEIVKDIPYKGIWFFARKPSRDYHALIYVNDAAAIDKIKERIPASDILKIGGGYINISGKEAEPKEDFGTFGF